MGCRFLCIWDLKEKRNLSAGEIMSQIIETERAYGKRISLCRGDGDW